MSKISQEYRGRIWAPFGVQNATHADGSWRGASQKTFYDHGYRQPGEHYHRSFGELLDCDLMGDEPHLREARAIRAKNQARRAKSKGGAKEA